MKWKTEKRKLKELKQFKGNPRDATEKQQKDLDKSLDRFDLASPLVVNTDGEIIGGNFRYRRLLEKHGEDYEIDVRVPEKKLNREQAKELNLRLNKNQGQWDEELLADFGDEDLLEDVGFDSEELDEIFEPEEQPEDDEVPDKPEEPEAERGDIYKLGEHRLMCGDATEEEDVEKLMNGKKADMVFTDPPYNVNYGVSKNPRHKIRKIEGDKQTDNEWIKFNKGLADVFRDYNKGDIYVWGASSPDGMRQRLIFCEEDIHWSATIIWKKQQLVLTPAKYQRKYEPCFYGWFDKSSYSGNRKQTEVWEVDRPLNSKEHPTMKPVELCFKGIENSSKRKEIVLDLFGGSGSTLIAAEKLNRKCYMMELDPKYCDVIIERWESYTGNKAKKL